MSEMQKNDLRVIKTREAIQSAFERLLEKTEFTEITVSAIAREARVSRKTFYAHYSSTGELLAMLAQEVVDGIAARIQPEGELRSVDEWVAEFIRVTLSTMKDNPRLTNNVVRALPAGSFVEVLQKPLERLCEIELGKRGLAIAQGHGYVLSFFIGGLCATYDTWNAIGHGAPELEEAADLIVQAATRGIGGLLEPVA